jgi:hypothetical protein
MSIWIIIILGFVLIVWFKLKEPFLIGWAGESFVSRKLKKLDPVHYKVLNNLLLQSQGNSKTTQIDHIVVSNYGIFCIETKSYKGWIFGNANQDEWTQVFFKFKRRFYNPLRQNYAHIKAVEALLKSDFPNIRISGFVAFPHADKLKISDTDVVGHAKDVVNKISSFQTSIFSNIDCEKIASILTWANIKDKAQRKKHNRDVRALKGNRID